MTKEELIRRIKQTAYLEGDFVLRSPLFSVILSAVRRRRTESKDLAHEKD